MHARDRGCPGGFALVIPALNEEAAIGSTLERALRARAEITARTPVRDVQVVFVNDGSTDGTQSIADRYPEVIKVRFESNRGYGAAIKAGFQASGADLVGFMDADGTCDPAYFVELINHLVATNADIVTGNRMGKTSEMPSVRRLGNVIFARLIGAVSGQNLEDSASGMRVIRRSTLKYLMPLPDGLHFTPAMSCIAVLDPRIRIEELPMPYKERIGRSKLRVMKDGVKFLSIILFMAACFNPITTLTILGLLFLLAGAVLGHVAIQGGAGPALMAVFSAAFLLVLLQAAFVGMLCHQLNYMLIGQRVIHGALESILQYLFQPKHMILSGAGLFAAGLLFFGAAWVLSPALRPYAWLACAACAWIGGWLALGGVINRVIWVVKKKAEACSVDPFEAGGRG